MRRLFPVSPVLPVFLLLLFSFRSGVSAQAPEYEDAPHHYYTAPLQEKGAQLKAKLADGALKLPAGNEKAALRAVLRECGVPEETQVLVFSKTSLQRNHIRPSQPRALYFSDETYIGWAPGGLVEIAAMDAQVGPVFYALDPAEAEAAAPVRLDRPDSCMDCHGGGRTNGVPGVFIRSVFPDASGFPLLQAGSFLTEYTSPLEERWGGWYVTGRHGAARHMGNVIAAAENDGRGAVMLDREPGANRLSLQGLVSTERYPQPGSDIAALMVLEHQTGLHSRLVEAAYALRTVLFRQRAVRVETGGTPVKAETEAATAEEFTGSVLSVARSHLQKILPYLLFAGEAKLPEGGISGDPAFQRAFLKNRRADRDGRSLKDFDLRSRLFRHRLSWQIYGGVFNGLPAPFKELLYRELWSILTSRTPVKGYEYFDPGEREAIVEILRSTKKDLPEWWRTSVSPP